jgi:hypothetical protein
MDRDGQKNISASPRLDHEDFWGREAMKTFFHEKKIVIATHVDSIWWAGYKQAMAGYPKTFQTLIAKHVSGWCGCCCEESVHQC